MTPIPFLAYIDPGVGATVIQLVLVGVVGIGALVKLRWQQIKRFVNRRESDSEPEAVPDLLKE